jgi:predicted MFS family arabinose efflux permease
LCINLNHRAFLGQVPLCLLAIIAVGFFLHLPKRQDDLAWTKQLRRIDFLGAVLLVATVFALLFGLDRGINVSWRSPYAIAFTCATLPLMAGFLLVETKFATEPFTPGHIMFNRALFVCYACNFFGYAAFTAFGFYIPLFLQVVLQMSPAQSGASMIPLAISSVVGTLLGGIIIKRTGKFYWLGVCAGITGTLGSLPIAWAAGQGRGSLPGIYSGSIVSFIPQGMVVTASLIAICERLTSTLIGCH